MRRVLQYIIGEVKEGRLAKSSAVELTREISAQIAPAELAVLHPLLHRNTSDLSALRFSTRLSGEEFYLRDHVVGGRKILPAVAHLELARAAVSAAAGEDEQGGVSLQQVTWIRPVVVGADGVELHIELFAEDSNNPPGQNRKLLMATGLPATRARRRSRFPVSLAALAKVSKLTLRVCTVFRSVSRQSE